MTTHDAPHCRDPENIRPLSGWVLPVVFDIDQASPGFLRWLMQTSDLRRQLCALAVAEVLKAGASCVGERLGAPGDPHKIVATALVSAPTRSLLTTLIGEVPSGYVGALAKCGSLPLAKPDGYRMLRDLLTNGGAERIAVIRQASSLDYMALKRLSILHPLLCNAGFVSKLASLRQVRAANLVVKIARERAGADDERIRTSAENQEDPSDWVRRWLGRVRALPLIPPALGPDFRALLTPEDMREAARRYRNCMKGRVSSAVASRELFVEHREHGVIIELAALTDGGYLMKGIWGASNARPPERVARYVWEKMSEAGVVAQVARLQSDAVSGLLELVEGWDDHRPFFHFDDEGDA